MLFHPRFFPLYCVRLSLPRGLRTISARSFEFNIINVHPSLKQPEEDTALAQSLSLVRGPGLGEDVSPSRGGEPVRANGLVQDNVDGHGTTTKAPDLWQVAIKEDVDSNDNGEDNGQDKAKNEDKTDHYVKDKKGKVLQSIMAGFKLSRLLPLDSLVHLRGFGPQEKLWHRCAL